MTNEVPADLHSAIKLGLEEVLTTSQPGDFNLDKMANKIFPYVKHRLAHDFYIAVQEGLSPEKLWDIIFIKNGDVK